MLPRRLPWHRRRGWLLSSVAQVSVALVGVAPACLDQPAVQAAGFPVPEPKPSARISVEPLGFVPPPRFYLPYRLPSVTLDFLDNSHLLFTFHTAKLMRREVDDPKEDQDQTIRALVLSVPEGRVEAEGTWRMHDRERYLWMLANGHFLVRERNTLYVSDKSLVRTTYLHPEGELVSVQLSPDASVLTVQYSNPLKEDEIGVAAEGDTPPAGAPTLGPAHAPTLGGATGAASQGAAPHAVPTLGDDVAHFPQKPRRYTLLVIDTRNRQPNRVARLQRPLVFPLVEGGYLGVEQGKGKQWDVSLAPFGGSARLVTSAVTSTCQPMLSALSETTFVAQTCLPFSSDHLMQAFDLQGHKLWEQLWQSRFAWGSFAYTAAGTRFAYGSIEVNHTLAPLDPIDESSILGQPIGIFSVATGKMDAVLDANPIVSAGENFSLSPDGQKLAILRHGAVEIYDLPATSAAAAAAAGPESGADRAARHP